MANRETSSKGPVKLLLKKLVKLVVKPPVKFPCEVAREVGMKSASLGQTASLQLHEQLHRPLHEHLHRPLFGPFKGAQWVTEPSRTPSRTVHEQWVTGMQNSCAMAPSRGPGYACARTAAYPLLRTSTPTTKQAENLKWPEASTRNIVGRKP